MVKTAIIPIAGMGTRFLPLSKDLPKELFPLVDKPILQYIVEEAVGSGIKKIIFITKPGKNKSLDYFEKEKGLEEFLKKKGKKSILEDLKKLNKLIKKVSFSRVIQKRALGDGHAVLMAKKMIKDQPFAVLFSDDIVESKVPCLLQLINVFQKYRTPVLALYPLPKEKLSAYGVVKVRKIKGRIYEIEGIKEKPSPSKAPSNLAIVGKYIITPEVFKFLEKPALAKGEIRLAGAFDQMIKSKYKVLGYKFEGKWLECGNKINYLKSNLYLSLKHPKFGKELKRFIKKEKF